jgi:hypothetical protein
MYGTVNISGDVMWTISRYKGRYRIGEFQRIWNEAVLVSLNFYSGTCVEGLNKTMTNDSPV